MLFALFASCITDNSETMLPAADSAVAADPLTIPLDRALDEMYATMDALYGPATRSSHTDILSIETLKGEHFGRLTRSGETLPENLLYIVNFGEENGFAVMGAATYLPSVLIIAEKGSLTIEEIIGEPATRSGENTELTLEDLWVEEDGDYLISASNITGPLLRRVCDGPRYIDDTPPPSTYVTYGEWTQSAKTGPLLSTKWHQWSPFNHRCPADSDQEPFPAGCIPIAVAQILAYNEKPTYGGTGYWSEFKAFDFYAAEPAPGDPAIVRYAAMRTSVAQMVREVGDGCNANYNYFGQGATFSTPARAKRYMVELGYSDAQKLNDIDRNKVITMLDDDCPVFVTALGSISDAHAWVIDGYQEQTRTVKVFASSNNALVSQSSQTRTFFHCNYGWYKGKANGYYNFKVFDTRNGAVETEAGWDPSHGLDSLYMTNDWRVDWHYRMITYSK